MSTSAQKQIALDDVFSRDIANAVICSMHETFNIDVTTGPTEYGEGIASLVGDISGIIGLVQAQLDGTLILCMNFDMMREILPRVLTNTGDITQEMAIDGVAELTNMIFGQVKRELNQRKHQIKLGIPCVVAGRGHFVCQFHRGKFMVVPFYLNGKLFQVYVALHESSEPAAP
jgi:chemotaxis protein CheX